MDEEYLECGNLTNSSIIKYLNRPDVTISINVSDGVKTEVLEVAENVKDFILRSLLDSSCLKKTYSLLELWAEMAKPQIEMYRMMEEQNKRLREKYKG